jgi:hypothetical protein
VIAVRNSTQQKLKLIQRLFAPPVLSSEDLSQYNTILAKLIETFGELDFVELLLIKVAVDAYWEMQRYSLHKAMVIEREHQLNKDEQVEELREELDKHKHALTALEDDEKKAAKAKAAAADGTKGAEESKLSAAENATNEACEAQADATVLVDHPEAATQPTSTATDQPSEGNSAATDGAHDRLEEAPLATEHKADQPDETDGSDTPPTLSNRKLELEAFIEDTQEEIDNILSANAEQQDHAEAFETGIDYYLQLDRLHDLGTKRWNNALEQLEFYRKGLGRELRRATEEVIDAEFSEATLDAPALAIAGDDEK